MNNSKTPKIVVGVGLAAIYAAGAGYFRLRGAQDSVPAQTVATAPSTQNAEPTQIAEPVPPPAIVPDFTDTPTSAAEQPAAATVAAPPVARLPVNAAAARPSPVKAMEPESRSNDQTLTSVAASPAAEPVIEESNPGSEGAVALSEPTNPASDTPSTVQAETESSGDEGESAEEVSPQVVAGVPAEDPEVLTN